MSLLYATGPNANILGRLAAGQITVTNEDANYPKAYLYDQIPCREFRFASAGANRLVTVDTDQLQAFGDMETAGALPGGWTNRSTGTGAVTRETTNAHGGAAHMRLAAGASGVAAASRDMVFWNPGDRLIVLSCWIDADTTNFVELRIQNLTTEKYLNNAGAWQASATYAARSNAGSYTDVGGLQADLESYLLCQKAPVTLRVTLLATANANLDVDDVAIGVVPNALTIHGHNVPMGIAGEWRHSADNSSYSTLVSGSPYQPSFALIPSAASTLRYTQFRIPGTPADGAISLLGELGLWRTKTAARSVNLEPRTEVLHRNIRNVVGGHARVHRQSTQAPRAFRFTKSMVSAAEFQLIRDDLARAEGGFYPILWIPDTNAPAPMPVLYGIVPPTTSWVQPLPTDCALWTLDEIEIHEQPFPNGAL